MKAVASMMEGYVTAVVTSPGAWIAAVIGFVIRAVTPSVELGAAVIGLVALWALDFVLGVIAAALKGEPVTAEKAGRGIAKLALYIGLLACLAFVKLVAGESQWEMWQAAQWVAVFGCCGREALSILQKAPVFGVRLNPGLLRFLRGRFESLGDPGGDEGGGDKT